MPNLTVRDLSEEIHRALRSRAARHGRSTEAEIRVILEETVRPPKRLTIGSEIQRIGREAGGIDELEVVRHQTEIRGADFK